MSSNPVTLSREQLHELVWQMPMIRLCDRFGVSDNGLRKICKRLDVPCPPAGWWAKRAAGKRVRTAPLPRAKPGTPAQATISPTPEDTGDLRSRIHEVSRSLGEIIVPERLARPHPVIAGWIDDHRKRQDDARRDRRTWPYSSYTVPDFTSCERRRQRLLNALFGMLGKHGATITQDDRGHLFAELCSEKIEFSCHEKSRQITRPMTAEEKRWETWNKSGVKKELEPTGRFEFQIRTWIDQPIRKLWLETDRQLFEAMMPEIAATFLMLGPVLAERTRQREEAAQIHAARQRELERERQRKQQDDNRWTRFVQIAEEAKRVEIAREFIARMRRLDLPESEPIDGRSLADWLDWAEAKARERDPLGMGAGAIFGNLAQITAWSQFD